MLQKYAIQTREKEKDGDAQSPVDEPEVPPATKEKLQSLERELMAYKTAFAGSPPLKRTDKMNNRNSMGDPLPTPTSSTILPPPSTSSLLPPPPQSTTPTKRRSKVPNTDRRNNDIEFATEIGQGLLLEVRKMQSLLQEKEEQLRALDREKAESERLAELLAKQLKQSQESEEHLKEDAWNLELAKQELGNSMAELQHSLSKSVTDQTKMSKQLTSLTQEVEILRSTEEKLTTQVETMKTRHEQDMNAMRKHSSTLQREKNDIAKHLETTVAELATVRSLSKSNRKSISDADNLGSGEGANANGSDDGANGKQHGHSPNASPPPSPTHAPRNHALELETLKTSLSHAHRMISNLRSSLHKEKQDRFELKKHLADSQETIEQLRNGSHMWADVGADRAGGSGYGAGEGAAGGISASGRRLKKAGNKKRAPARRAKGLTPRRPSDEEEYEDIDDIEVLASENSEDDDFERHNGHRRRFVTTGKSLSGEYQQWEEGLSETSDSDSVHTVDAKSPLGITPANFVPLSSELSGSKDYHAGIDMGVNTDPVVFVSESVPVEQPKVVQVDMGVNTEEYKPSSDFPVAAAMVAGSLAAYSLAGHTKSEVPATADAPVQESEPSSLAKSVESPINPVDITTSAADAHDVTSSEAANDPAAWSLDATESTQDNVAKNTPLVSEHKQSDIIDANANTSSDSTNYLVPDDQVAAQLREPHTVVSPALVAQSEGENIEKDICEGDTSASADNALTSATVQDDQATVQSQEPESSTAPLPKMNGDTNVSASSPAQAAEENKEAAHKVDVASPTTSADISSVEIATALAGGITGAAIAHQVAESKSIPAHTATASSVDANTTTTTSNSDGSGVVPIANPIADIKPIPVDTATAMATEDVPISNGTTTTTSTFAHTGIEPLLTEIYSITVVSSTNTAVKDLPAAELATASTQADYVQPMKTLTPDAGTSGVLAENLSAIKEQTDVSVVGPVSVAAVASLTSQVAAPGSATVSLQHNGAEEAQQQQLPTDQGHHALTSSEDKSTGPSESTSANLVEAAALTGGVAAISIAAVALADKQTYTAHHIDSTDKVVDQEAVQSTAVPSAAAVHPHQSLETNNQSKQDQDLGHAKIFTTTYPTAKLTQKNLQALSASPDAKDIGQQREFDSISRSDVGSDSRRASSSIYQPISEKEGYASTIAPNIVSNVTQTMIGNWMWKSTRKTVGSGFSDNRHRRFFWIHPYSRTLYWSMKEPGTNGEAKAKSAFIESITAVEERSQTPPGLPAVSLLVKTTNREIKFTATDAAHHEIWLQSINYLLSRPANSAGSILQTKKEQPQSMRSNPSLLKKASFQRLNSVFSSSASNAPSKPDSARYAGNDEDLEDLEDVRMCCDGKHHISKLEKNHHHPHRNSRQYRPVSGTSFDRPLAMSIASGNGSTHYDH
ncbi:hypothetical protein Unana1_05348 [Umbelopsis nana]